MKKAKTLFISSVILATGFLAVSLISGNYQIKPNNVLASSSDCPSTPPHQTNIHVNPSDPKVNESVSIKTDSIPECPTSGIPTSCEWRWSGSVNRTTTNKSTGQFSTSFSSSGNKNINVEVYSSMQGICGGKLIQVAYGDISFTVSKIPTPTPTPTHKECNNNYTGCISVAGAGANQCTNDASCTGGCDSSKNNPSGSNNACIAQGGPICCEDNGPNKNTCVQCGGGGGTPTPTPIHTPTPTPTHTPTPTSTPTHTPTPTSTPTPTPTITLTPTPTITPTPTPTPTITPTPTPDPTLSCNLSANPNSGTAPLNDVDLTAAVSGTATGNINYYFDCDNDGTWEQTFTGQAVTSKTVADLCDYASNGTYTAKAKVERGGFSNTCSTSMTIGDDGGGGGTCSYWQEGCYSTPTPTPTPTITPTLTPTIPVTCIRAPFGPAIPETLCLITVANGGTCVLTNNDGFTVRLNVPANAVVADSIVDLSIHNPTDYSQLSTTIGISRLIGPKIVYVFAQDQDCQPISFLKDAIITFIYPNSYSRGYLESSFIVENTLSSNGSWNFLTSSGNAAANSLVSITKNLGYFGIFGRLAPIILGTATASPKPSPICPVWPTPTPFIPDRPTDAELIESFFVASLIDSFKNLRIGWCEFLSFLNLLLILLLLWLAFGKKGLNNSKEKDNSQLKTPVSAAPSIKRENWLKKFFGFIAASFTAFVLVQKKAWKDYKIQSQERKLARQNGKSLSVASLIIPETVSQNNANRSVNPETVQGSQFIAFTEDKN